jgi:hypothetical protein
MTEAAAAQRERAGMRGQLDYTACALLAREEEAQMEQRRGAEERERSGSPGPRPLGLTGSVLGRLEARLANLLAAEMAREDAWLAQLQAGPLPWSRVRAGLGGIL